MKNINMYQASISKIFLNCKNTLALKLSLFFRLNLMSLNLNYQYKYNIYFLLLLVISVISSIIIRSNIINVELLYNKYSLIVQILFILSIIYSLKLIFDIIKRIIQAYKIIPEFISLYKDNMLNIKSLISLYYIQNIFFNLLSCWILFNILSKLNTFIDGIYLVITGLGIISSIIFIYYYPLKGFNFKNNNKNYPIWVYLILLIIILFYMLILPLLILNIINSDKFIYFKNEFINNSIKSVEPNLMESNSNTTRDSSSIITDNNRLEDNIVQIPKTNNITNNITTDTINLQPSTSISNTTSNINLSSSSSSSSSSSPSNFNSPSNSPSNSNSNSNSNNKFLTYLSKVLNYKIAIRKNTIHTNHYYLNLLSDNNIETKYFKHTNKGTLNYPLEINKEVLLSNSRIENGNIILENNNKLKINNLNKKLTLIEDDFINYNRYLINDDIVNKDNYNAIKSLLNKNSFWSNYDFIKDFYDRNLIDKTYFKKFIITLINESVYQSNENKDLIDYIKKIDYNDIIIDFEDKISNRFIYLNGTYSYRVLKNNNFSSSSSFYFDFTAYSPEGVLHAIAKEITLLKENNNPTSIETSDILVNIYNKYKSWDNYPGVIGTDLNLNKLTPIIRQKHFFSSFENENSIYKFNFKNQTNNTFFYLEKLKGFIFKFDKEPIWIDCNNKVGISHYIKDLDKDLTSKVIVFISKTSLYNNENLNFSNKNNYEIIKDITSYVKNNPNNVISLNNEYTLKLNELKKLVKQIIVMERALKLDIPNLNSKLIQNQNNIKLIPDIEYLKNKSK